MQAGKGRGGNREYEFPTKYLGNVGRRVIFALP